ncbi:interleukin-12 receptor subunit beta-2-like isoform X1 [Xyrauchen texanus]|uniref:interleukin-12 receptor subunit beta-2-like isoform X1 n=1 Tax=Xyrauchen texanus TaxID=154827 RepID=UPI00224222A4|nr:interleukin-12 receptor subunit beta-2-like isoform X1 [Xyrauchen texanus]
MSSECTWSVLLIFHFILAAGAVGGTVCTVKSSGGKEVLVGSNFTVSCLFKNQCTKLIFQDKKKLMHVEFNSSVVSVDVKNLTKFSIFTCKCMKDPEPCGIDITPGHPPSIPENLTCIRKTEFGNVSCTWKTGRDTKITTTCQLRVEGVPDFVYKSVMNSAGFCSATFPIIGSMSHLIVWLNVSNSLGSTTTGPHTFTLSNIVKPSRPNIRHLECSSQYCSLHTNNHGAHLHLFEVKYRGENETWKNLQTDAESSLNISSLQPHTNYEFQIRRKINHTVGLWSDWSLAKTAKTKEEAPDKVLDVWYLQEHSQSQNKCFLIFWKELSKSDAKGEIQMYNISEKRMKVKSIIVGPTRRHYNICCTYCSVSVSAINSVGQSPVRFIELRSLGLVSGFVSHNTLNNHSIALFWSTLAIATHRTEYVLHWYPVGRRDRLEWIRVVDTKAIIRGLHPKECYQGAVTALCSSGFRMASIEGISTWKSVPEQGPVPQQNWKKSESLQVKWSEIPHDKRRGCLTKYTVYLKDNVKGDIQNNDVKYPMKQYTISGLSPGHCYNLWVTAWTDAGEGPRGSDLPFCTPSDTEKLLSLVILAGGAVLLTCLVLLCICQFSCVQSRFLTCCKCLMPRDIPDPANSKWAKDCAIDQGEMKFPLHQYDSSMSEEPDTVEVEVVPYPSSFTCTYIKSFSQTSGCSDTTLITRSSDIMEDYICTHGARSGEEEGDEFKFLPCTVSPLLEPHFPCGGKLTLDVVKIDCSEFLDCT